ELGVDLRVNDGAGEFLLGLQNVGRDTTKNSERIDGHRDSLGTGDVDATEVDAGLLAHALPHALHPVAVDLHERLARDDRVGSVVPRAVHPSRVSLTRDLAEEVDRAAQARIVEDCRVRLARGAVKAIVNVWSAVGGEQRMESVARLEGVAA